MGGRTINNLISLASPTISLQDVDAFFVQTTRHFGPHFGFVFELHARFLAAPFNDEQRRERAAGRMSADRPGRELAGIGRVEAPDDIVADMRIEGLLQVGRAGGTNNAPAVIELTMAEGDGT